MNENVFNFPWVKDGPVVLGMSAFVFICPYLICESVITFLVFEFLIFCYMAGPRFKDAFQEPSVYLALQPFFEVMLLEVVSPFYFYFLINYLFISLRLYFVD